jgi:hypothetical protein
MQLIFECPRIPIPLPDKTAPENMALIIAPEKEKESTLQDRPALNVEMKEGAGKKEGGKRLCEHNKLKYNCKV